VVIESQSPIRRFNPMTDKAKDILFLIGVSALFGLVALLFACTAKADYVVEVSRSEGCYYCDVMKPRVEALQKLGCDIRVVDFDQNKRYARQLGVRGLPAFVYIRETAGGDFIQGRMVGEVTLGQLQRFCASPELVTVGAAARSAVRSILGSPTPVFPGW